MSQLFNVIDLNIVLKSSNKDLVKCSNFSLEEKKSLIILGQSGCGKTMTCNAIMNLLNKKIFKINGSIIFQGTDILKLSNMERRNLCGKDIALIPQNPMTALDPSMRIGKQMDETLHIHTKLSKKERKELIITSLENAGLNNAMTVYRHYPHTLSGGMLQRVLIAMSLMSDAKLIIADEPTTALDVIHKNETVDSFLELKNRGAAVMMITHDFAAAKRMGGDMIVMKDGEIIESGNVIDILKNPQNSYTKDLIKASVLI